MGFSLAELETEGCQVRRRGQWHIRLVTRGQWRVFCSAVWLHEVSGVSSTQLFGYTRMAVAGLLLCCLVTGGCQWRIFCSAVSLHVVSGGSSAQLFRYRRMAVAYFLVSCLVTRGQWRIFCSALHEDGSVRFSAQLFG
jgi:hypothetical protein